jgi:hypothetical protein
VGPITKYQVARDLGMDIAKPDRHMRRLAATTGETVQAMCECVAEASGDRTATVDLTSDGFGPDLEPKLGVYRWHNVRQVLNFYARWIVDIERFMQARKMLRKKAGF